MADAGKKEAFAPEETSVEPCENQLPSFSDITDQLFTAKPQTCSPMNKLLLKTKTCFFSYKSSNMYNMMES